MNSNDWNSPRAPPGTIIFLKTSPAERCVPESHQLASLTHDTPKHFKCLWKTEIPVHGSHMQLLARCDKDQRQEENKIDFDC